MKIDPSARKALLRDWMTATTQIGKTRFHLSSAEIAERWNQGYPGIKMTERWVNKALYGVQTLIKK